MRALLVIGVLLIVFGIASPFVGIPHRHSSGLKIGDAQIGVQTQTSERIPLPASIAIILGGVVLVAVGGRPASFYKFLPAARIRFRRAISIIPSCAAPSLT